MTGRRVGALHLRLVVWACIVGLGLLRLWYPLGGDQALFLSYARGLESGASLYGQLWDNKQPGIFWFYAMAGTLFGFTGPGIHLFEWLWVAAAAVLLQAAARPVFTSARATELVPLLTAGLYYWCAGPGSMTQIEALVMLPLAGCLFAGTAASRQPGRAPWFHAAFGACAAVVVIFKLVLAIVPVAMWLVLVGYGFAGGPKSIGRVVTRMLLPALVGAAIPLGVVALHFVVAGSWEAFVWANFVYPRRALLEVAGKPLSQLFAGARWLLAVALPAAALAIFITLKDLRREPLRLIEALVIAWLLAGTAVILVQKFSWWSYHFQLLLPPVGLMAATAIDRQAARMPRGGSSWRAAAALAVAAMFALYPMQTWRGLRAAGVAAAAPAADRLPAFREALDDQYRQRRVETAFLRAPGVDGAAIYVFGNPNLLLESGRSQALAIHGWSWEFMLASQWAELAAQLGSARPAYVYVDASYVPLIRARSPATLALIGRDYAPADSQSENGTWYRLR